MKKFIIVSIVFCLGIVLMPNLTYAQEETCVFKCNKEPIPKVIITRKGEVEAEPDKATVNIKVVIEETKIEKAFEKNKEKMNQVIETLKQEGTEKKDIKTIEYYMTPMYEGKPLFSKVHRPTSYIVTHTITANIYKLDTIGKILNKISDIESVSVYGLEFTSTKLEDLKKEALKKAAQSAKESALVLVEAAGGKLGKVLRIEESTAEPLRRQRVFDEASYAAKEMAEVSEAQVEAGTLKVEAYCTITYEIEKM